MTFFRVCFFAATCRKILVRYIQQMDIFHCNNRLFCNIRYFKTFLFFGYLHYVVLLYNLNNWGWSAIIQHVQRIIEEALWKQYLFSNNCNVWMGLQSTLQCNVWGCTPHKPYNCIHTHSVKYLYWTHELENIQARERGEEMLPLNCMPAIRQCIWNNS